MNHLEQSTTRSSTVSTPSFFVNTKKPELLQLLSEQQNKDKTSITSTHQWWYTISSTSDHIPLSIIASSDKKHTAIDSVVQLDSTTSNKIYDDVQSQLTTASIQDEKHKESLTLSLVQSVLDDQLGIIENTSSAESEQQSAITTSSSGIIDSNQLSQKMCTMRAGYMMKVLAKLGWEVYTICGTLEQQGHAWIIARSPSGDTYMIDPMNPLTHTSYRSVNSTTITASLFTQLKEGTYTRPITMNEQKYILGMVA